MNKIGLIVCSTLFFSLAEAKPPAARRYQPNELSDLEAIVPVLRRQVAYVHVEAVPAGSEPLGPEERDGYGVVIDNTHVALLPFIVADAKKITINGPNGKKVTAKTVLFDLDRRVAIIESSQALGSIGFLPTVFADKKSIKEGEDVFALTTSDAEGGAVHGVIIYAGDDPEYEGHYRADLKLEGGMPVFNNEARCVGYSRSVAWDKDKLMLVTPEMIKAARTATGASERKRDDAKGPSPEGAKPWWSK